MDILLDKYYRILKDLKALRYRDPMAVDAYRIHYDKDLSPDSPVKDELGWEDYKTSEIWTSSAGVHCWFRTTITLADAMVGQRVVFRLATGHKEGWDISNPQFLLYVNGDLVQGLDVNHRETLLTESGLSGQTFEIALLAYSNLLEDTISLQSSIVVLDPLINDFYYNLSNVFWALCNRVEDDYDKIRLFRELDAVFLVLDLRDVKSNDFYESIEAANERLKLKFYSQIQEEGPLVSVLGHTHIDVAWLWTTDQTREKVVRSFSTVLYLMSLYPDYVFMSSQPQLYAYLKEEAPSLFEQVKEKVKEGRWEVDGGMWVEADCNIPSGESLSRQFLYGIDFIKSEFQVDCSTLWLPDVFGYSAALPQLIRKAGLSYFMTTKIEWNQFNKLPHDTFMWQGIDGTEVLTHLVSTSDSVTFKKDIYANSNKEAGTTYNGRLNPNQVQGTWSHYRDKIISDETLQLFGFGDGGGGPTQEMLENYDRLKYGLPGLPRVEMSHQKDFFKRLAKQVDNHRHIGKWRGELYLENHRGTYTSLARNKRYNRQLEFLYQDIEFISTMAKTMGYSYPKDLLKDSWKTILLNQFHDIIPGTSIKEVYDETDRQYEALLTKGHELLKDSLSHIGERVMVEEEGIILMNTLSHDRNDLVEFKVDQGLDLLGLKDEEGQLIPLYPSYEKDTYLFQAKAMPAKGYRVYTYVAAAANEVKKEALPDFEQVLSNSYYDLRFNEAMELTSIYDKENKREIIAKGSRGNVLQLFEDRPSDFENWNIDYSFKDKVYEIQEVDSCELIEDNPLRTCVRLVRHYNQSTIDQVIVLSHISRRIDFRTQVDWHEKQVLLKVAFDVDINTDQALYETQYGYLRRDTHENTSWSKAQFEVCGHKWADLSESAYGVSLLNDCKYGYDIKDGLMRQTLLKCGTYPNPDGDQGSHVFTYALLPHEGPLQAEVTVASAFELNVPHRRQGIQGHKAMRDQARTQAFLRSNSSNIVIDTIKEHEGSQGTVVRLYESMNQRTELQLTFAMPLKQAWLCNLIEEKDQALKINGHQLELTVKPFEVVTLLVTY